MTADAEGGAAGLPDHVARALNRRLAEIQTGWRVPDISGAVARDGAVVFSGASGEVPVDAEVAFRIGSITKVFTAVLVMQLRDEGRLSLDDPLAKHLPDAVFGDRTLRDLLAHLAGLTREPPGEFWEAVPGVGPDDLLAGLRSAAAVLPTRRAFHYSNVAFALLGLVVDKLRGARYDEVLVERILRPLDLRRTSYLPVPPHATGYRVHPYADVLREEPANDTGAMAPAGQLWSTPTDLVRFGAFLADPAPAVLAADTVAEMCEPVAMRDPEAWTSGYGLGLQLFRRGDRVLVGHGGSMPGFMAGLAVARRERIAAAMCVNSWMAGDLPSATADLAVTVLDADPPPPRTWRAASVPDGVLALTGVWYYRGAPAAVSWRDGVLWLGPAADPCGPAASSFALVTADEYRGASGGETGETLRVERDERGVPVVLDLATWRLTRTPDDPRGGP